MGSAAATVSQLSQRRPGLTVSTSRGLLTIWEWWRTPTSVVEGWDSQGLLFAVSNACKDGKSASTRATTFNVPVGHVWPNMILQLSKQQQPHIKGRYEKRSNRPWFVLKKKHRVHSLSASQLIVLLFFKKILSLFAQPTPSRTRSTSALTRTTSYRRQRSEIK